MSIHSFELGSTMYSTLTGGTNMNDITGVLMMYQRIQNTHI